MSANPLSELSVIDRAAVSDFAVLLGQIINTEETEVQELVDRLPACNMRSMIVAWLVFRAELIRIHNER